jgi:hypothetical protein
VWDLDPASLNPAAKKRAAEMVQANTVPVGEKEKVKEKEKEKESFPPASATGGSVPVEEVPRRDREDMLPFPLPLKFSGGPSASCFTSSSAFCSSIGAYDQGRPYGPNTRHIGSPPDNRWYLPCPFIRLVDHNTDFSVAPRSALKSVSFCPYNPNVLMSSGYESAIKVQ